MRATTAKSDNRVGPPPNFVSGASVSARTMRDAILDPARTILRQHSTHPPVTEPTLDAEGVHPDDVYDELVASGSVVHRIVTNGEATAMYNAAGWKLELVKPVGADSAPYADFGGALVTPARIGLNLLGSRVPTPTTCRSSPPG